MSKVNEGGLPLGSYQPSHGGEVCSLFPFASPPSSSLTTTRPSSFGQACRLAGIQKVSVSRWTGQTRPKYANLDIAQDKFDAWMSNDTYLPEITAESQAIADLAEEASLAMRGF
jgi:hypothetical protein